MLISKCPLNPFLLFPPENHLICCQVLPFAPALPSSAEGTAWEGTALTWAQDAPWERQFPFPPLLQGQKLQGATSFLSHLIFLHGM